MNQSDSEIVKSILVLFLDPFLEALFSRSFFFLLISWPAFATYMTQKSRHALGLSMPHKRLGSQC